MDGQNEVTITIDVGGEAFQPHAGVELARILRTIAEVVESASGDEIIGLIPEEKRVVIDLEGD